MKSKFAFILVSVLIISSMLLASCQKAAEPTETPVAEATPTEAVDSTETAAPAGPVFTKEVRQAIAAAIDREAMVDRVFEGRNLPAYSFVPESYPYATEPFLDKYGQRDLELSKELLTQAGYSTEKPLEMEIWYPPEHYGTTTADVMQVLKEQLEETGMIKVSLQSQNWAEYVDSFVAGRLPVFMLGWFADFVDPDTFLSPFASCLQSPDNGIFYCNEEMDKLLLAAASTTDTAERESLYKQVGDLFADEVPSIPLFWEPEFISYRKGVEGIQIGAPFEFLYNSLNFTADATPASGSTDTIIIGTTDEVNSLDPADAYSTHDWEIIKNTGVSLMRYKPGTAELEPGAAADFPVISDDGLTYTFTLREGITFADGTPVTSQDYVDSWNRLNSLEGQVSGLVQLYVESVEATDDLTVVYHLKGPYAFFPAVAATAPFVVTNPNLYSADQIVQFPEKIDGIGAYRMVSYVPGEQTVLEANPTYFGEDKPIIKNVIIKYFAEPGTMSNALEKGEIDIAWRVLGPVEAVRLQSVEGITVESIEDAPALRFLSINNQFVAGGE